MNVAYLILGTNLGNRKQNFINTKNLINTNCGEIIKQSLIYETAPWGKSDQPKYLNQVIVIKTSLTSFELLNKILYVENELGRVRLEKYGERIIDIDILFFNREIIKTPFLTIPHPHICERRFVLLPLAEIVPYKIHPEFRINLKKLLQNCTDVLEVSEFTS